MQVTQTLTEGLKHEFQVVIPASDVGARADERLGQLKNTVQLRGFRPGKVPVDHLKKVYGRSVMAETIDALVNDTNAKIVSDRGFKLATAPKIKLPEDKDAIEALIAGRADLSYTVALEVMPEIKLADFKGVALEKPVAEVTEEEIEEALKRIAEQNSPFAPKSEGGKAETGDRAVVSFVGRVDGKEFDAGKADDVAVQIGAGQFIPGFEDQLVGLGAGETGIVKVTFPNGYANAELAGKEAEFEVQMKSVETPVAVTINEDFAKSLGLESLEKLRDAVKDRLQKEHESVSRQKVKRQLLDQLDRLHAFDPPPTLVEDEFNNVWTQVQNDLKSRARTFEDEGTTEEAAKTDYRKIAERRVRLGLVLAEIGEKNGIKVADEEVSRALVERVRMFPGQEQQVWDYYRKNPEALASIRAPIYEEKVVDFILELGKMSEKKVSREELFKEDDTIA